jgi:hypothetical protein
MRECVVLMRFVERERCASRETLHKNDKTAKQSTLPNFGQNRSRSARKGKKTLEPADLAKKN